jgi:sarcosine oxidase
MMKHDVLVVGLGVMGAATVWKLAEVGVDVLGIDSLGPTHANGSSHGATRIFRRAYWEGEKYIPLLNRADELWQDLQKRTGRRIIYPSGGVFVGPRSAGVVEGSARTAVAGGIPHEIWDAPTIRERLPAFRVTDDMQAIYESGAYALAAEEARLQMLNEAVRRRAAVWYGDAVECLDSGCGAVTARTRHGSSVEVKAVVITVGPWAKGDLLPELTGLISPNRVPIYWFSPRSGHHGSFDYRNFPVFLYECHDGSLLYGIGTGASAEPGVKVGFHNRQHVQSSPDGTSPPVTEDQRHEIARYVEKVLPGLVPNPVDARLCFYTMSRDESFLIGTSRTHPHVHYASACSGHGFKFAPAIGEALACLAQGLPPPVSLSSFSADRFSRGASTRS